MYITIKDLEMLKEVENYLFNINKENIILTQDEQHFVVKKENLKDGKAMFLYLRLWQLINELQEEKENNNLRINNLIQEKRKQDKMYGRSKKEKERHNIAVKKRLIIDYVDELLQRYTDDEVGQNSKPIYNKMTQKQKYQLYINTISQFNMRDDIENLTDDEYGNLDTNLVICFDYGLY